MYRLQKTLALFTVLLVGSSVSTAFAAYDTDGLVLYWKLDETTANSCDSGDDSCDVSGHGNHGAWSGDTAASSTVATLQFSNARSLTFDGTGDYVSITAPSGFTTGTSARSITGWIRPSTSATVRVPFAYGACTSGADAGKVFGVYLDSSNTINFWGCSTADFSTGVSTANDTWAHIAVTYDGSNVRVYKDGTQAGSTTARTLASSTAHMQVGGASLLDSGNYYFPGLIDDIRVYTRNLSASEIAQLAAGNHTTAIWNGSSSNDFETAGNWDINAIPDPFTHILIPEGAPGIELSKPASGASLTIGSNFLTGSYVDLHGFDFEFVDSGELKGGGTLRLLGSETTNPANVSGSSTGTVLYYGTGSYTGLTAGDRYYNLIINDGLVGYWDFDAVEGGFVRDVSGYDNDGIRANIPNDPSFETTIHAPTAFFNRYSMDFDGDDYVEVSQSDLLENQEMTISTWVKLSSSASDRNTILSYGIGTELNADSQAGESYVLIYHKNSNILRFRLKNAAETSFIDLQETPLQSLSSAWTHITATWNGSTATLYQDGVLLGTATATDTINYVDDVNTKLRMGNWFGNDERYFNGYIDDIRIYDRPLQDHEISALAAGHTPATASGIYTLDAHLRLRGSLTLAAGQLDVSSSNYSIPLSGSWLNYGGQFNARSGAVDFQGDSGSPTIQTGGQPFYSFLLSGNDTFTLGEDLVAENYITFFNAPGTLDVSTNNYTISTPSFGQSTGTFNARSGVVVLNSTSDASSTFSSPLNELQIEDPTENGLIAYWKFDECQGDTTADSSGNSQTGTIYGPALWTGSGLPAPIDFDNQCALSFDGSDDQFVESASNSTLTGNASFSVALWFYVPSGANTDGNYGRFVDWGSESSGASAQIAVYSTTINQLFVGHWGSGQASSTTFSNDEWHHAVWVRTGGSNNGHQGNKLYLDGVEIPLDINVGSAHTINVTADEYDIGGRGSGNLSVECTLDDVRIYDRELTPQEVHRLAQGQYADGSQNTATFTLGADLDLNTLSIFSGKLSPGSNDIAVSGDWNNYAGSGSFIEGTSTVDLDGASTQNVRGSTEFYDFEISTSSAQTVNFGSGSHTYVSNLLTFAGAASNLLTLSPLSAGYEWFLSLGSSASQAVSYVAPSYSNATGGLTITPTNSIDGGNNTNWSFLSGGSTGGSGGGGGWLSHQQALDRIRGSEPVISDTESPTLLDVGIADEQVEKGTRQVGGILDPSMRTVDDTEFSRRIREITQAVTNRFTTGLHQFRELSERAEEFLKTSAPSTSDTQRRLMRAEQNVNDNQLSKLTASAIGERRGLLVAKVKAEEVVYNDVPVDSWFAPYVSLVVLEEIATGYADDEGKPTGTFGVENPVTYAEILKMALMAASTELADRTPRNQSAQGNWTSAYVATAEELGLDVFDPSLNVNEPASRAEVIHTLLQVLGLPVAPNASHQFTDLPDSHPYSKSIATAQLYGLITGDLDTSGNPLGTVRPDASINRAEVAKMIAVLKQLLQSTNELEQLPL